MSEIEQLLRWVEDLLGEARRFDDQSGIEPLWDHEFLQWLKSKRAMVGLRLELLDPTVTGHLVLKPTLEGLLPVRLRPVIRELAEQLRETGSNHNKPPAQRLAETIATLTELRDTLQSALAMAPQAIGTAPEPPRLVAAPGDDRIVRLRIKGLRSIASLTLDVDGLRVLIGENGAGKSSIVEACELLSRAPSRSFMDALDRHHGGVRSLLRHGATTVELAVDTLGQGGPMTYTIALGMAGLYSAVVEERLELGPLPDKDRALIVLERMNGSARVFDQRSRQLVAVSPPAGLLLSVANQLPGNGAIERMIDALSRIQVHVPFFSSPSWVTSPLGGDVRGARQPNLAQPTERLDRFGSNLSNAWLALRNDPARWNEALELVQLGLGYDVEDILTTPLPGGQIVLQVKLSTWPQPVPLAGLSDGQVAYLAFVAMAALPASFSLLIFDEVELHLHPGLLIRVLGMFERMAERGPVVLTTHSDGLLDALDEPADVVRVLELDEARSTRVRAYDRDELKMWLEDYRGVGSLRAEGMDRLVMKAVETS